MGHLSMVRIGLLVGLLWVARAAALNVDSLEWKAGGYMDAGRFQMTDSTANGELLHRMGVAWNINHRINDAWSLDADLHWLFWRNQQHDLALFHVVGLKFDADMRGALQYQSGMNSGKLGVYDFKYNPDSKNLGEYLLRSTAYPTLLESSQGKDLLAYSYTRVAGVEYGFELSWVRLKALVYAEQFNSPVYDVAPVFLASAGPEYAEVQAGIALDRYWMFGKRMVSSSLDSSLRAHISSQGLSTKATKLMLRTRLDLAQMLDIEFAPTFYAEAALLGLKNDTLFYKHMAQRMPVMAGVDLPTWGLLTTFSVEAEYLKNPYYARKYPIGDAGGSSYSPLPNLNSALEYLPENLPNTVSNDWRWSIYAKRSLNNWIDLEGRAASDHMRLYVFNGDYASGEPYTRRTKDWYFLVRISYHN